MLWLLVIFLSIVVIVLWVQLSEVRNWATRAGNWMDLHYNRHRAYHQDWVAAPQDGGEGGPPPFP